MRFLSCCKLPGDSSNQNSCSYYSAASEIHWKSPPTNCDTSIYFQPLPFHGLYAQKNKREHRSLAVLQIYFVLLLSETFIHFVQLSILSYFRFCPIFNFAQFFNFVQFSSLCSFQICPIFQICPVFNFVQFSILPNFQFCPIFNFAQFSILPNFQFCPILSSFSILSNFSILSFDKIAQ